jgi:hypothetical protein
MLLEEINGRIREDVGALLRAKRVHPLLRYALDPTFEISSLIVPDETAKTVEITPELRDELVKNTNSYVFVKACLWILKFYRDVNGRDYRMALKDLLDWPEKTYSDFVNPDSNFRRSWKIGRDNTEYQRVRQPFITEDIHTECWLLLAEGKGENSKLTRGMEFFLKTLRPDFGVGEFHAVIEQWENTGKASKGQIRAADLYEEDFIAVLRALQTGNGVGWLSAFNRHPLTMAAVKCEWGLLENGGIRTVALRVVGRDTVSVKQGGKSYEKSAYRSYATFTWDELKRNRIDPEKSMLAASNAVNPVDFEDVRLIRVSRKDLFHQFIAADADEIQAAELWALTTSQEPNVFFLGESLLVSSPSRLTESLELYLHKLDLRHLDRSQPIPLRHQGRSLLKIGAAPWLRPSCGESEFQFHLNPETWLVFGEETELELRDFYGDPSNLKWSPNVECRDNGIFLSKDAYETTTTATVLLPERGYRLRVSVVFLPEEMRGSMLSENTYNQDGISWHPQTDLNTLRPRVKGTGRCPGLLTLVGGEPIKVSVPSENVHFWIREGLYTDLCFDTPLIGGEEILQKQLTVECYLPPGLNTVTWGDCDWFTREEAGYYSFDLKDLLSPDRLGKSAGLRVRTQSGQEFEILKVTESPAVAVKEGMCSIVFPNTFRVEDWDYCLVAEGAHSNPMGELVASGSCAELNREPNEVVDRRLLDVGRIHPDEGCSLVLCARGSHRITENPQEFFSKHLAAKPTDDFHGPFVIQDSNPLRTKEGFAKELQEQKTTPILLPAWVCPGWGQRATIQICTSTGFPEDFLKTDFTEESLDSILSDSLCGGGNWLAHESWGASSLTDLLEEIEARHAFSEDGAIRRGKPNFSWRKMVSCSFLKSLKEITKGKKPDEVWLPLEFVGFEHRVLGHGHHTLLQLSKTKCLLNDAPRSPRSLRFSYGGQVQLRYSDSNEFMPLSWEAITSPSDEHSPPDWWPENGIGDLGDTPHWSTAWKVLNSIYYNQIKEAQAVLGRGTEGNLSHLFRHLVGWMKIAECSTERRMIFQSAVLCRIHAWLGSNFGDERSKEILSVFVSQAWQDPAVRQILKNDILTVDWMLAWLHAPGFNADES